MSDSDPARRIAAAVDPILADHPEHNTTAEHEHVVAAVTAAALAALGLITTEQHRAEVLREVADAPALPAVGDRYVNRLDSSDVVTVSRAWDNQLTGLPSVLFTYDGQLSRWALSVGAFHRLFRRSDS